MTVGARVGHAARVHHAGAPAELLGEPLIPIGTVYDTFISRGLDALVYALYNEARFILVATPSGVSLAPEGGAHQSTITPSLGIELPNLRAYEPAFAREVAWCLEEGFAGCIGARSGFSTYLRLTTRAVDQSLSAPVAELARLHQSGLDESVVKAFVEKSTNTLAPSADELIFLKDVGVSRDQVYIANVLKCRPPNNRTPEPDEIAAAQTLRLGVRFLPLLRGLLTPRDRTVLD